VGCIGTVFMGAPYGWEDLDAAVRARRPHLKVGSG
jgi:hypothetical protein